MKYLAFQNIRDYIFYIIILHYFI